MSAPMGQTSGVTAATVLDRPVYTVGRASELLGVKQQTFRRWLDGYRSRHGKVQPPILRVEPTGSDEVTWGEYVEGSYLRQYRQDVPLQKIRAVVARLRDVQGIPYPLAHSKPFVDLETMELVIEVQNQEDIPPELRMVERARDGQIRLTRPAEEHLKRIVVNDDGIAFQMSPAGPESPVRMDPLHVFGDPAIRGIRTSTIAELLNAGEPFTFIAETYGLSESEIAEALRFEEALRDGDPQRPAA